MQDSRLTDSIAGFEYDAGCWIGRVVVERLSTGRSEATTRLLLQLELVGLSRLGTSPLKTLKDNVPGYQLCATSARRPPLSRLMTELPRLGRRVLLATVLAVAAVHASSPRPATTSSPSSTRSWSRRAKCSSAWRACATRRPATARRCRRRRRCGQPVLDSLIDERVLVTNARESGLKVEDPELDRAVANVAQQNQLTLPQMRERLRQEGIPFAKFRDNIRDQMLVERLREREVVSRIKISDADIDDLIDKRRAAAGHRRRSTSPRSS